MSLLSSRRSLVTSFLVTTSLCSPVQAGILNGSFSPVSPGSEINLTTEGKLDWVHWGLFTDTSVDRKAGVTPSISSFTVIGGSNNFLTAFQYADNPHGYTWLDGTPTSVVTNTLTGVWAYSFPVPLDSGFRVTVPADTTARTVSVYVGAYNARGSLVAWLSDGSAPGFTNGPTDTIDNIGQGPGGVFSLEYAADSPGQTLNIEWTLALTRGAGANVTLQAATLTSPEANNPPFAAITSPTNFAAFEEPASVTIEVTAQDVDGSVTNVSFYAGTNLLGVADTPPYTLTWTNVPRGKHRINVASADDLGAVTTSDPIEFFVYGSGGGQTNAVASSPEIVDLTAEGTADWTHWGLLTSSSFNYKSVLIRKISNFAVLGDEQVRRYSDNFTSFIWSDGVPTAESPGTTAGVFMYGLGNGFLLSAPADEHPRTLRLYAGGYGFRGELEAHLSDFSAPPWVDTSVSNIFGSSYTVYTIQYSAASSNQQLRVRYRSADLFDFAFGNVTLQAATLQGGPADPLPVRITDSIFVEDGFAFSFATETNRLYWAEFSTDLQGPWMVFTNLTGNGFPVTVTNQPPSADNLFYRVRLQ